MQVTSPGGPLQTEPGVQRFPGPHCWPPHCPQLKPQMFIDATLYAAPMATEELEKKVVRTSPVLWVLGVVFATLLGGLGTHALVDIADMFREPALEEYRRPRVEELERRRSALQASPDPQQDKITRAERDLGDLERTLGTAEESWRTWLSTRATLGGKGAEDAELRHRRDQLDQLRKERDDVARSLTQLRAEPNSRAVDVAKIGEEIEAASRAAEDEFEAAHRAWSWKVLSARLALVIPIWLLAAWLWARRRESKYLTLLWGYWAFALWMLLYGIGPYLPHYGGYLPLGAGTAVAAWASISLVRFFNRRAPARRRRIVDRALGKHLCPGCDRDYLIGCEVALDAAGSRKMTVRHFDAEGLRPRACPACGLTLFGACAGCGHLQVVHLDKCAACGAVWTTAA